MKQVVIVDYGVGNLLSVARAFEKIGTQAILTSDPDKIFNAERVVLPGVGAFGDCMNEIVKRNLSEPIMKFVKTGKPMLGICVGMQVLHSIGKEFGEHIGLNIIEGVVDRIPDTSIEEKPHKVPHIGWAKLHVNPNDSDNKLIPALRDQWFYFVHGFMAIPSQPNHILAFYDYNGRQITACTYKDNIYGVQFHPEKSGENGLRLLEEFLKL